MCKNYLLLMLILFLFSCKNDQKENKRSINDPALSKYFDLISLSPNNDTLYYERAIYLYHQNNYTGSIQDLQKAIMLNPNVSVYYNLLSDAYFDIDAFGESVEALKKLVAFHPEDIALLLKLSEVQWIGEDYIGAASTIDEIFKQNTSESEAYYMNGLIKLSLNDTLASLASFNKTILFDPKNMEAFLMAAHIYEDKGDPLALEYYDKALLIDPDNIDAKNAKAFYLMGIGKLKEALVLYKQVIVKDKYNEECFLNTGIIYLQLDSLQKALNHFDILINIAPDNGVGYYYRGITYKLLGLTEMAIENFKQALVFQPGWDEPELELNQMVN